MEPEESGMKLKNPWQQVDFNDEDAEISSTFVDNKILQMMKKMGYQSGFGLGKNKQGIVEPISIEPQYQRRGLGLKIENSKETWDYIFDNTTTVETITWLYNSDLVPISLDNLKVVESKPNINFEEEYNFCDKEILHEVITAKNIFDEFDLKEVCQARTRANPFETIRSVFFMNRAALKMANIDAVTEFMFTNIDLNQFHKDTLGPFYFADVCAGPGGFSEYVLWRKKWRFKGFGFTLRGDNDFKLTDSVCASPVTFHPFYGVNDDGNVCCPENIEDFTEKVLFETEDKGVHFMMSDGGFSVEGNENLQEILSKNIYICQCFVALEILRQHGHFVTKVFDMFTCFSVGLFYLLCHCFDKVAILKPNSSRPANAERYIICSNYKGRDETKTIRNYMKKIVDRLWQLKDKPHLDITEIIPLTILKKDHNFFSYICDSNNRIAKYQTINLKKLAAFCRNPTLIDHRQESLRTSCLKFWQIPDTPKVPLGKYLVEDLLIETIHNRDLLLVQPREISSIKLFENILDNLQDFHYVPMNCRKTSNICNFYAGVGFSKVYRLQYNKWVRIKNVQLTRGTLLYGELVKEKCISKDVNNPLQYKYSLHVIDALRLGDLNLGDLTFKERNNLLSTYCKAINHEFRNNLIRIRPKIVNQLKSLPQTLNMKKDVSENFISQLPVMGYNSEQEFYDVNSILFLKTNKDQSFHSTYVLRTQFFINDLKDQKFTLEALTSLIENKGQ